MIRSVSIVRGATAVDLVNNLVPATSVTSVQAGATTYPASATNGYSITNTASTFSLTWAGASQPAAGVTYTVNYVTAEPDMIIRGSDYIKSAFVAALRAAFAAQTWFPLYRYNTNDTLTGVAIHETFPRRTLKVPTIVVSVGAMAVDNTTLSESDYLCEVTDESGTITSFRSWGGMTPEVKIEVYAIEDSDRRKLTDITAIFCRHLFRRFFAKYGIGYKRIRINGEGDQVWQHQVLLTNSISIPCYTEWQVQYPVELVDIIDNLEITVTPTVS